MGKSQYKSSKRHVKLASKKQRRKERRRVRAMHREVDDDFKASDPCRKSFHIAHAWQKLDANLSSVPNKFSSVDMDYVLRNVISSVEPFDQIEFVDSGGFVFNLDVRTRWQRLRDHLVVGAVVAVPLVPWICVLVSRAAQGVTPWWNITL